MDIFDLLEKVVATTNDMETYFFNDEDDVINTLGGIIICGEVENHSYLVTTDEHLEEKCDFVVYDCGTLLYAYKIEN